MTGSLRSFCRRLFFCRPVSIRFKVERVNCFYSDEKKCIRFKLRNDSTTWRHPKICRIQISGLPLNSNLRSYFAATFFFVCEKLWYVFSGFSIIQENRWNQWNLCVRIKNIHFLIIRKSRILYGFFSIRFIFICNATFEKFKYTINLILYWIIYIT